MLFFSSTAHAQQFPFWTSAARLDTGASLSESPTIATLDQQILVAWSDDRLGNQELFTRESLDGGHTWTSEERLTDSLADSLEASMASDPLNVHLVWVERTTTEGAVWYRCLRRGVWEAPIRLSAPGDRASFPRVAATRSYPTFSVYVVWESEQQGRSTALLRVSHDAGKSWQPVRAITEGDWETRTPAVAAGPKVAYLVWIDARETAGQVVFKPWGDTQLAPDVRLTPAGDARRPTISADQEQLAVAWETHDGTRTSIRSMLSSDGGRTWSLPEIVTETPAEAIRPFVQIVSGDVWLFWQDGRQGRWNVYAVHQALRAGSWTDPVPFISNDLEDLSPAASISSGSPEDQLHLVWSVKQDESSSTLQYRRRDTIPPDPPPQPVHVDANALPGYDDDGTLVFSWPEEDSTQEVTYRLYVSEDEGAFLSWQGGKQFSHPPVQIDGHQGHRYRVVLETLDEVGNASVPSEVSAPLFVDKEPPVVAILAPLAETTLFGQTPVRISCMDDTLHSWELMFGASVNPTDWSLLTEPGRGPVEQFSVGDWDLRMLQGIYTLRLVGRDLAGNLSEQRIQVTIDNRPLPPLSANGGSNLLTNSRDTFYRQPAWGPTNRIAYISNSGGATDVWTLGLQQRTALRLTQDIYVDASPDWSPDGAYVTFGSRRDGRWGIWAVPASGGQEKPLLVDAFQNYQPTWSPNGEHLAFASDRDGDYEIWILLNVRAVLDGDVPSLVRVTDNLWDDRAPSWSPNGTELVFQSKRNGNWDLFRIHIDGEQEQRLTEALSGEFLPQWSADGKRILFVTDREQDRATGANQAYMLDALSGEINNVADRVLSADWSPTYDAILVESPEGLRLVELISPVQQLEARIEAPASGAYVQGQVEISGFARGSDFAEYRLELRRKGEAWQSLGGRATAPVERNGFLGRLDTTGLEGRYELRLTVEGTTGATVTDQISVLISTEAPTLSLESPREDERVAKNLIQVIGRTDPGVSVWVNDEPVQPTSDDSGNARFAAWVALSLGENAIRVSVRNPLGGQTETMRRVVLDRTRPEITLDTPLDFESTTLPYITLSGSINVQAEVFVESDRVSLPSIPVPLGSDRRFQRAILLRAGTNRLTVRATDPAENRTELTRRVVYQAEQVILEDRDPPAAVNLSPMPGQVLDSAQVEVEAILVDDVGLDLTTLQLQVDGAEIATSDFRFDEDTGTLNYAIPEALADGAHNFQIAIADRNGHLSQTTVEFQVDTSRLYLGLSAELDGSALRMILASNRPLWSLPGGTAWVEPGTRAYAFSLTAAGGDPIQYTGMLDLSLSQQAIRLTSEVYPSASSVQQVGGYFAYGELPPGGQLTLPTWNRMGFGIVDCRLTIDDLGFNENGESNTLPVPEYSVTLADREGVLNEPLQVALRSQMAIDMDRLAAQALDAESRDLQRFGLVYEIVTGRPFDESLTPLTVQLEAHAPTAAPLALFHWNTTLQHWDPVPNQERVGESFYRAQPDQLGAYTLFDDREPPRVVSLKPADQEEVPLDRFLVEAKLEDRGAGVAEIALQIDGEEAAFEYRPATGDLLYLPTELDPGLHRLQLRVTDRALNVAEVSSVFFTQDVFEFADAVVAYPNPVREQVSIRFKLTRLADVTLSIYDVTGTCIYQQTLEQAAGRPGLGELFTWDLNNQRGERAAPGIYVYQLEATRDGHTIRREGKIAIIP